MVNVLAAATVEQMESFLGLLGTVFTFLIGKIVDLVDVVMANPLLLVPIGVILAYTIVAMFRRLF